MGKFLYNGIISKQKAHIKNRD